jgi:putative ABC transport system permease protein
MLAFSGDQNSGSFEIQGRKHAVTEESPHADYRSVTPGYFEAMRIPLQKGRVLTDSDGTDSTLAVVIDETLAQRYWLNQDPIGQSISIEDLKKPKWLRVVGVVRDVRSEQLDAPLRGTLYFPHAQTPNASMAIVIRTVADPMQLVNAVRGQVLALDHDQPIFDVKTMEDRLSNSLGRRRFTVVLLSGFSLLAMMLAGIGIYGVMAYAVAQRTHEIGIRMALGAAERDVLGMVLGQGLRLVCIGLVAGLAGALLLTKLMSTLLYGVSPDDPPTYAAVSAALIMVAIAASYFPARRAIRIDPINALRYE